MVCPFVKKLAQFIAAAPTSLLLSIPVGRVQWMSQYLVLVPSHIVGLVPGKMSKGAPKFWLSMNLRVNKEEAR